MRPLLEKASKYTGLNDPAEVKPRSSTMFVNLLYSISDTGKNKTILIDRFNGFVQGLRNIYSEPRRREKWAFDKLRDKASGNPL